MSWTDATSELQTCISLLLSDSGYTQCLVLSGIVASRSDKIATPSSTAVNAPVGSLDWKRFVNRDSFTPTALEYTCDKDPTYPSPGCCFSASKAAFCDLSPTARTTAAINVEQFTACKKLVDEVVFNSYQCTQSTSTNVLLAVFLLGIVAIIATLRRSTVGKSVKSWHIKLWALLVKNWVVAKRKWRVHAKSLLICTVMVGILAGIVGSSPMESYPVSLASDSGMVVNLLLFTPSGDRSTLYISIQPIIGIFFLVVMSYPMTQMIINIVSEKEHRIQEMFRVTGLKHWIVCVSWVITNLIMFLPFSFVLVLLTKIGQLFINISISELAIFFISFFAAMSSFILAVSVLFTKAGTAIMGTMLTVFVMLGAQFGSVRNKNLQGVMCVMPPACFATVLSNMIADSMSGIGFTRSYVAYTMRDSILPFSVAVYILLLDAVFFFLLAIYLDKVIEQPGITGRLPFYYIFQSTFWFPPKRAHHHHRRAFKHNRLQSSRQETSSRKVPSTESSSDSAQISQQKPSKKRANLSCIQIMEITRRFPNPGMTHERVALNKLSLKFAQNEITSLLGHNGAGKTTLLSILTGSVEPSEGDATIFGYSIRTHLDKIRPLLGICPQYDVLFLDLTPIENIRLFAALKQCNPETIEEDISDMIHELNMKDKANTLVRNLSLGQRRKISIAIALIGPSRAIFLDEPTAGMDPFSRRCTWEFILNHRSGKAIVLTTHFMDEAEKLGDNVAIMADGKVLLEGTPLKLKAQYGKGYRMIVSLNDGMSWKEIQSTVHSMIPAAKLLSLNSLEVAFQLPYKEVQKFPDLFRLLEQSTAGLKFGISESTLEEVFLSVCSAPSLEVAAVTDPPIPDQLNTTFVGQQISKSARPIQSGFFFIAAMCRKRIWLYQSRRWLAAALFMFPLLMLIIPIVMPPIVLEPFLNPKGAFPKPGSALCQSRIADSYPDNCCRGNACRDTPDIPQCINPNAVDTGCWKQPAMGFCDYVPLLCTTSICCDISDYRSPWYACQTYQVFSNSETIDEWVNYNVHCPRRGSVVSQSNISAFLVALLVFMAFIMPLTSVISDCVTEVCSERNTKLNQRLAGVPLHCFWFGSWIIDQAIMFCPVIIEVIILASFNGSLSGKNMLPALILFAMFAIAVVPIAYVAVFMFNSSSQAVSAYSTLFFITGPAFEIVLRVLQSHTFVIIENTLTSVQLYKICQNVFLVSPPFALMSGLIRLQDEVAAVCLKQDTFTCFVVRPIDRIRSNVLFLAVDGVVALLIIIVLEKLRNSRVVEIGLGQLLRASLRPLTRKSVPIKNARPSVFTEDMSTIAERERLQEAVPCTDTLQILGLRKVYDQTNYIGLADLWLGVPSNQCFGFLGLNGAGKSTTLQCLTGSHLATSGRATINGVDIIGHGGRRPTMGYCPQYDPLFENLSVLQHLRLYASIAGVPSSHAEEVMETMKISQYRGVLARHLSGGSKRKLSVAIAVISDPSTVLLDEPSTGMDPLSKRTLWSSIQKVISNTNAAVMLTTHSMEECEALCARVGILVAGRFVCIGSPQALKSKFGPGYTIEVRTKAVDKAMFEEATAKLTEVIEVTKSNISRICSIMGDSGMVAQARFDERMSVIYAHGRTVSVKVFLSWFLQGKLTNDVIKFMHTTWPNDVRLKDRYGQQIIFEMQSLENIPLSTLFSVIESRIGSLYIEQYSITQSTLEQVFNVFAEAQARLQQPVNSESVEDDDSSSDISEIFDSENP